MLNKVTAQLTEEVLAYFSEKCRKIAHENPEICLVSMLTLIKKRLPFVSATLAQAIEGTTYDEHLKEAKIKLAQAEAEVKS